MQGKRRLQQPWLTKSLFYQPAVLLSLILTLASCQTLNFAENQEKQEQIEGLIETKLLLVKSMLDKGQATDAWSTLRPMLAAYPQHPDILNICGLTHLALANTPRALSFLRRAYQAKPSPAIGLNISSVLISQGSYASARKLLRKLLTTADDYTYKERLWHNMALSYDKENKASLAERYYKKALAENPGYYLSHLQLGYLYKQRGRSALASKHFWQANQQCRSCYAPVSELSSHMIKRRQYAQAINLLRRYLHQREASPENSLAAKALLGQLEQRQSASSSSSLPQELR